MNMSLVIEGLNRDIASKNEEIEQLKNAYNELIVEVESNKGITEDPTTPERHDIERPYPNSEPQVTKYAEGI